MKILIQSRKAGSLGVFAWDMQEHASVEAAWGATRAAEREINVIAPFTRANVEKARLPVYLWGDDMFEDTHEV